MAWKFRKRINIGFGTINLTQNGVSSITVGKRGLLSVNTGKNGTYLNQCIPKTGLYNRTKLTNTTYNTQNDDTEISNNKIMGISPWIWLLLAIIIIDITYYTGIWH